MTAAVRERIHPVRITTRPVNPLGESLGKRLLRWQQHDAGRSQVFGILPDPRGLAHGVELTGQFLGTTLLNPPLALPLFALALLLIPLPLPCIASETLLLDALRRPDQPNHDPI